MQPLRNARFLARLVLVWFALALGVAVASPLVKPQSMELVCSAGSMKLVVTDAGSGQPPATHTLDCPLCATHAPPPEFGQADQPPAPFVAGLAWPVAHNALPAQAGAPLPPRGPPSL